MHRPLWQIFLTIFAVGLIVQRTAGAVVVYLADGSPVLLAALALQVAAALATAVGLWLGRRWVVAAVLCVGVSVVATSLLGALYLGAGSAPLALSQSLVTALATGGLALMLRQEFDRRPKDLAHREAE